MFVVARITVAQAATVLNAVITAIQTTLGLAIVVVLIYAMHDVNSAINWSIIARKLHSSLWPTLLRTDSASSIRTPFAVRFISALGFISTALIVLAGIITPLGLRDGPTLQRGYRQLDASYVSDPSPIGITTSPRDKFTYGRICGAMGPVPCPGNGDNGNTSAIASSTLDTFSSTSQGPFNMQFRRYYLGTGGYNYSMAHSGISVLESLILRTGIFAIEGLVVDMSNAGVGLWNHTMPKIKSGGVWSQDILWLEPVTSCVNTNLTINYTLENNGFDHDNLSLVDMGGFVDLTTEYPMYSRNGQDIDIRAHAYKSAVLANFGLMKSFNLTARNQSFVGKAFPINTTQTYFSVGSMEYLNGNALAISSNLTSDINILCQGYGGADNANITNVGVHCGLLLAPPERTDGGDVRLSGDNSTWSQSLHACASVTRARLQKVHFSFNDSSELSRLSISRQNTNTSVLWATEKTNLTISDVYLFWGRVADSYENDQSLSTMRSEVFYVPAGSSDTWDVVTTGQPPSVIAAAWSALYQNIGSLPTSGMPDYTGNSNAALLNRWQSLLQSDPAQGPATITNLVWSDLVANNLVGSDTANSLFVAQNEPSITYDLKYGIPVLLVVVLWLPLFAIALFTLLTGKLTLSHMRHLLNQTSVGRIVVGDSALVPINGPAMPAMAGHTATSHLQTSKWSKTVGQAPIAFRSFGIVSRGMPGGSSDQVELLSGGGEVAASVQTLGYKYGGEDYRKGRPLGQTLTEFEKSG